MKKRLIQIGMKYLSIGAAAAASYFGVEYSAGQVDSMLLPVVTGLVAIAAHFADLAIHKNRWGSVLAPSQEEAP